MAEKRSRPSGNPPGNIPPARNLGTGNRDGDPIASIVAAVARKEKLRHREGKLAAASQTCRRESLLRYAELHAASAFSFLNGASLPEDLVQEAARLSIPAVALVDSNGVYGAPRFYKAAKAAGIKALVGAEVTLREERHPEERSDEGSTAVDEVDPSRSLPRTGRVTRSQRSRSLASLGMTGMGEGLGMRGPDVSLGRADPRPPRLTLLVENRTGYKNLCRLLTAGALDKPKGQTSVTLEQVAAHAEGLHCLTGGEEGPLAVALAEGGLDAAGGLLDCFAEMFPGRLHVELQRHRLAAQEHRNRALVDLAHRRRLPLLATNGVRYARSRDKELHDVLTCIRLHTTLDRAGNALSAQRERF